MAARIHEIVLATAPDLMPRTYYGMPGFAKDGKVICFFQSKAKFKVRYSTLGFQQDARLDDEEMWPVSFALLKLTPANEKRITELVKKARTAISAEVTSVYEAAGGFDGLRRLARAWHERVLADEVVSHAFHDGVRDDHIERLAAYWSEALGGPAAYSATYGDETFVVRLHSGNGEHGDMDRRAIDCFDTALGDVGLTAEPLRSVLHEYFAWATTTSMAIYHASADDVPPGLTIPRWSWEGLVSP
jgi:hemoglobin